MKVFKIARKTVGFARQGYRGVSAFGKAAGKVFGKASGKFSPLLGWVWTYGRSCLLAKTSAMDPSRSSEKA